MLVDAWHDVRFCLAVNTRWDPITGGSVDEAVNTGQTTVREGDAGSDNVDAVHSTKNLSPHLGPVRNVSGVRCVEPPGGKSSITFG